MSKTKCMYFLKFGLAPHFGEVLSNDIKASPYFSVSFDEAFEQMLAKTADGCAN